MSRQEDPGFVNMELELLHRLRKSTELLKAVEQATAGELALQERLRSRFDAALVRAALSLTDARRKANGILPDASRLWLTQTGLEQATHPLVAAHKAERFPAAEDVLDLCTGIGSDAAALARRGPVRIVDCDAAMLQRCLWNLEVWNVASPTAVAADVRGLRLGGRLVHADPDRRSGRSRPTRRLEQYSPDLAWMQQLTRTAAGGAIKLGSASNFIQKFPGCEIELVSLHGECREATVWFGNLTEKEQFRATVLPSGETIAADPLSAWATTANEPAQYVYDPDSAVVRSGLIDCVCERLSLERLDPEEEYLTSGDLTGSPFVTPFEVESVLPNNLKKLRQYLRQHPGQRYEIKCRRIPVNAAATAKKLPTGDGPPKVVFFLRVSGKARVVVARRIALSLRLGGPN